MILEFTKIKYGELMEEVDLYDGMGITPGQKLSGKLSSIQNAISALRAEVGLRGFASQEEEIEFFKKWKPLFLARHLYELEHFKLMFEKPQTDEQELKAFYVRELNYLQLQTKRHQFFYQYFITDSKELDNFYFLRNAVPPNPMWTGPIDYDQEFGTPGDSIFAHFLCNEWLKTFLLSALSTIGRPNNGTELQVTWTGEKQNLIEIAYGIWLTKQMNDGRATLLQIIKWLETSLQVDLGNIQKGFANIRARKRLSPTKYLDQMKEEILKKIDDDLV